MAAVLVLYSAAVPGRQGEAAGRQPDGHRDRETGGGEAPDRPRRRRRRRRQRTIRNVTDSLDGLRLLRQPPAADPH